MFLIIVLGDLVVQIPMPVLVGIMIMVSIGTFDWSSFSYLVKAPRSDAAVMLVTVIIVVATHDLSKGVIAGVLLSAIFFVAKISKIKVTKRQDGSNMIFDVDGQLFFASVEGFVESFDFNVKIEALSLISQTRMFGMIRQLELSTKLLLSTKKIKILLPLQT